MSNRVETIVADPSPAFLPAGSSLRRLPRRPERARPADFTAAFEDRALYYDAFWHADGERVLLVGPPPVNLAGQYRKARFTALPSRASLRSRRHPSLSVMTTELRNVPPGTHSIVMDFADEKLTIPVGASLVPDFAGKRLLFTMNRDNDLDWIRFWATHHASRHGTDAVILFDNGSTRYGLSDIAETLASVPGLAKICIPSWPWAFGRTDKAVSINPYWAHFLQIASMTVVLRRMGAGAEAILNCDIDELAHAPDGASVYALARGTSHGLLSMKGQWVEPVAEEGVVPRDHGDFPFRLTDEKGRFCRAGKWAIDPSRPWLQRLRVHPYWHWIEGRPLLAKRYAGGAYFWHFRGINTGWKVDRSAARLGPGLERDPALAETLAPLRRLRHETGATA